MIDLPAKVVNRNDYIHPVGAGQVHIRDAMNTEYERALKDASDFNRRRLLNRSKVYFDIWNNCSDESRMAIECDPRFNLQANNPQNVEDPYNPFVLVQIIKSTHYGNSGNDMYAKRQAFLTKLYEVKLPVGVPNPGFVLYQRLSDLRKEERIFVANNPLQVGDGLPGQIVNVNNDVDYTQKFMEKSAPVYRDAYVEYLRMMQRQALRFDTLEQAYKFVSEFITDADIPSAGGGKRKHGAIDEDVINGIIERRVNQTLKKFTADEAAAEKGRQRKKEVNPKPSNNSSKGARPCLVCLYKFKDDKNTVPDNFKHFPTSCPFKDCFQFKDIPKDFLDKQGYKPKNGKKADSGHKKKSVLATIKEEADRKKARHQSDSE